MRAHLAAGLIMGGVWFSSPVSAQNVDPNLAREVTGVREDLVRSHNELLKYIWTEQTEVLVGGKLKSSSSLRCGYDNESNIIRTPLGPEQQKPTSRQTSNRPSVRSKGEMQDYIERAISRIREYAPPNPAVIDHLLTSGQASLGASSGNTAEVLMTHYFQDGDSLVFTYEPASKRLLRVVVSSSLSGRKDPVTLDAVYELLPGNVNHLATATLKAPSKKVQVNVKNVDYKKLAN
jgi:hypothetical protein